MFTKIISQLSLSPATVEQLARYAVTIRKKQRLYGYAAIVLATVSALYALAAFLPTEQSSTTDTQPLTSEQPPSTLSYSHAASTDRAAAGDTVSWELLVQNPSDTTVVETIQFNTADIDEYASITSASDQGVISTRDHNITWLNIAVAPGETHQLTATAQLDTSISKESRQHSNPLSYDCQITTSFGTTEHISVDCPVIKQVESIASTLPSVDSVLGLVIFTLLFITSLTAHITLRLHSKEIRIIRSQITTGGTL